MKAFLNKIESLGLKLETKGNDLFLKGAGGKLSSSEIKVIEKNKEVMTFIKDNKSRLITFLKSTANNVSSDIKINKDNIAALYELSPLQEGILFHCLYNSNSNAYKTQFNMEFPEGLDVDAFRKSWDYLINNHTVLRTAFIHDKLSIPVQCVYKKIAFGYETVDFSNLDKNELEIQYNDLLQKERRIDFDFKTPPLMRITLVKIGAKAIRMIWTKHHIVWDGWSGQILMKEFIMAYTSFANNVDPPVRKEDKFEEYIRFIKSIDPEEEKLFWTRYLQGFLEPSLLPFVNNKIENENTVENYKELQLNFNKELTNKIVDFTKQANITVNTLLQGVWSLILSRYLSNNDIVFGVSVSGRPPEIGYEEKIGMFINTIPFRATINEDDETITWLQQLQAQHVKAREFQYTSLSDVKKHADIKNNFFDSILIFRNFPVNSHSVNSSKKELIVQNYSVEENNNFPLSVQAALRELLSIGFKFNSNIIDEEYIQMVSGHFEHVLLQLINSHACQLKKIRLLPDQDMQKLISAFNNSTVEYSKEDTVLALIDKQTKQYPDKIAVQADAFSLTFQQLRERSNQLANNLIGKGIGRGDLIGIYLERSVEMIIGILGIIKSGAAYVPLDPEYPEQRTKYILDCIDSKIIVTTRKKTQQLSGISKSELITIDDLTRFKHISAADPEVNIKSSDLMYVIFTSGTTGDPKGVEIRHRSVVNFLLSMQQNPGITVQDILFSVTTYSFDISILEFFLPLIAGAQLYIAGKDILSEPELIIERIGKIRPTLIQATPGFYQMLFNEGWQGDKKLKVLCGGDLLNGALAENLIRNSREVWNMYGPTETTIWSSIKKMDSSSHAANIGKPINNTQMYILDPFLEPKSIGTIGAIYIGGEGLAKGYYKNELLTIQKFIKNPFKENDLIYETGDLGKRHLNGDIEFLGRNDSQVKINGFRIELGEIESVLQQHEKIEQCAVIGKQDASNIKRLIAYIVTKEFCDKLEIISFLKTKLPAFMIPSVIIELEALPFNANGKIDRKQLPDPGASALSCEYVEPTNEIEKGLAIIWLQLLQVQRVGINDNFFELGGHSLLAMRVASAVRKQFKREVSIRDVVNNPTIYLLAQQIVKGCDDGISLLPAITPQLRTGKLPLSFNQERLHFIDQLQGTSNYHMPVVLQMKGKLNKNALEAALKEVLNRHEVLRTAIRNEDGIGYQVIQPLGNWKIDYMTDIQLGENLDSYISEYITRPFDLSKDIMLRATLLKRAEIDHVLVVTIHHISCDGWSMNILMNEVTEVYAGIVSKKQSPLAALPIQYADYSLWQRQYFSGESLSSRLSYWKEQLTGVEPLNLPLDYPRPAIQSTKGAIVNYFLDKELVKRAEEMSQQEGVTLFMMLLSIFKILLYKYSGQNDIAIGTSIAGRPQQELEKLIGFFVNTLVLRSSFDDGQDYRSFLQQVKQTTLDAYSHQEIPFEVIVDAVVKQRDVSRSPLFDVMFVLQNTPREKSVEMGEIVMERIQSSTFTSKFSITMNVVIGENGINLSTEYCTGLFKQETIQQMLRHYEHLLRAVIDNPVQRLDELKMLSKAEAQQLQNAFNDTEVIFSDDKTIVDLFNEQVLKSPSTIAAIFGTEQLTYSELDERSNQLGSYLRKQGIREESLVPICLERSLEMIISIMGILKAGAAYVPVDPAYPPERITYILEDIQADILITKPNIANKLSVKKSIALIDVNDSIIKVEPKRKVKNKLTPASLIYVIYTSGSTGKPKGVMNEHTGLVNRLLWAQSKFPLDSSDTVLQKTTYSFDVSVWELLWPLLTGAKLVFAEPEGHKDNAYLRKIIVEQRVTLIHFVPSMLEVFLLDMEDNSSLPLKWILCSGEALQNKQVVLFQEKLKNVELWNLYGPTEAAIDVSYWKVPADWTADKHVVPIGRPVWNTQLYVLDKAGNICPVGITGELHIGGVQVARGYWNRPELNKERFITDTFINKNGKLYKTGDLARWLLNGDIEYIGRIDDQVKIRGFRIELGEIEQVMQQHEAVKQCVVQAKADSLGNKRLIGYIVSVSSINKASLIAYLQSKLPDYMVPAILIELEALPLTPNGKIDRKALPDPDLASLSTKEYAAPNNAEEEKLVRIWKELLRIDRIGVNDNFFELGGDSIISIQLVSRAKRVGISLKPIDIFKYQTISRLSKRIQEAEEVKSEQGTLTGKAGLLPIQNYFFEQAYAVPSHFNQSVLLLFTKSVTTDQLRKLLSVLELHHDALRFHYVKADDDKWLQYYGDGNSDILAEQIISGNDTDEQSLAVSITGICEVAQKSLSLTDKKIVKAVLMKTPESETHDRLLIVVHHLAIDGVSWRILLEDLEVGISCLKAGKPIELGSKSNSYREFYNALTTYGNSRMVEAQLNYWQNIVNAAEPLQVDKNTLHTPLIEDMAAYAISLDADLTINLLQKVNQAYQTEINDILIIALSKTIGTWTGKKDVIFALEGHGRELIGDNYIDTSRTIGWFTNLYPIKISITENNSIEEEIKLIKEQLRTVPDKGMAYGYLRYLHPLKGVRDSLSRDGLYDIVFNYLGQLDNAIIDHEWFAGATEFKGSGMNEKNYSGHKLAITGAISGGALKMTWSYSKSNYNKETIVTLAEQYKKTITELIIHCESQTTKSFTPSDFGLSEKISNNELDAFLKANENAESDSGEVLVF